ncbi:hypothetical protein N7476_004719 [Penicillium atrosanguineum]|uniref:Uncharacterized protein n=1 Tax=Penicillium atrosanguineum TaxID=1132637 RepID=A0A9W9Q1F3_9EURO|nr:hypothetical protein N7476_004719 [Penicillium atrosanguineum]
MQHFAEIDCRSDFDLEEFWNDFTDAPTPPPCLASGQRFASTLPYEEPPQRAKRPPFIESIFYPSYDSECGFSWPGPDPLSSETSADEMFLYMSAFLLLDQVHWLEFRLCELNEANNLTEQFLFFVPRFETILGNISRVRGQMHNIMARHDGHFRSFGRRRFQLLIYPRQEATSAVIDNVVPALYNYSAPTDSVLDPGFFVRNIVGGFED